MDNAQPADLFRLLDANSERMIDFDHLKEFAKPRLLIASKVPRLGEHPLDQTFRFIPFAVHAGSQEFFARAGSRAMCGDDISDDGSKFIDHLHRKPRSNNGVRKPMGAHVGSRPDWASGGNDPAIDKTAVKACQRGGGLKNIRTGYLWGQGKTIFFGAQTLVYHAIERRRASRLEKRDRNSLAQTDRSHGDRREGSVEHCREDEAGNEYASEEESEGNGGECWLEHAHHEVSSVLRGTQYGKNSTADGCVPDAANLYCG